VPERLTVPFEMTVLPWVVVYDPLPVSAPAASTVAVTGAAVFSPGLSG
jgi:hypothetical protein